MSSPIRATMTPSNSLPVQLEQIGLHAVAAEVDDFLARDLSRHPEAQALDVRPHDLETYDELAHSHDDDPKQ